MKSVLLCTTLFSLLFTFPATAGCAKYFRGNAGYVRVTNLCNSTIYIWYCGAGKHISGELLYPSGDYGTNIYNDEKFRSAECTSISGDGTVHCRKPNEQSMGCR